jgi:5-methylcytosine-specific restriction endonuclease McrA
VAKLKPAALKVEYLPLDALAPYERNARTHSPAENLQLLCGHCNRSKGARDFQTWLARKFQIGNR